MDDDDDDDADKFGLICSCPARITVGCKMLLMILTCTLCFILVSSGQMLVYVAIRMNKCTSKYFCSRMFS